MDYFLLTLSLCEVGEASSGKYVDLHVNALVHLRLNNILHDCSKRSGFGWTNFDILAFNTAQAHTINNQVKNYQSHVHCSSVQYLYLDYLKYGTSII